MDTPLTPDVDLIQQDWDARSNNGEQTAIPVHGAYETLMFNRVETSGNTVSVWVGENSTESPDYIIVNPPTDIILSNNETKTDPIAAIAVAINGADS